jgi:hypothetical protein
MFAYTWQEVAIVGVIIVLTVVGVGGRWWPWKR